jgi:hypothetical protein
MGLGSAVSPRVMIGANLLLAGAAFFGGVGLAEYRFPGDYDWRYMTISTLQSAQLNPDGARCVAWGISLTGLVLLPIAAFFFRRLRGFSERGARIGSAFMFAGLAAMVLIGITPKHPPRYPKLHEHLVALAMVGMVVSVSIYTWIALRGLARETARERRGSRGMRMGLLVSALLPVVGTGSSQLYLYCRSESLGWVNLSWRARGVPVVLSLAFWEWLICGSVFAYLGLLCWLAFRLKAIPMPAPSGAGITEGSSAEDGPRRRATPIPQR